MWTGLYARAAQLLEALRAMSTGLGVTPFSLITLKNIDTMYAMFIADGAACARAMREGLKIVQATGVHTWTFQLLVWGYGFSLGVADLGARGGDREQLEPLTGQAGRFNLCIYRHFQAWDALLRKDLMEAFLQKDRAALRMAVGGVGCPLYEALCRLGLAGILADCGDERRCISRSPGRCATSRAASTTAISSSTCLTGFAQIALAHGRQAHRSGGITPRAGAGAGVRLLPLPGMAAGGGGARARTDVLDAGIEPDYAKSLIKRLQPAPRSCRSRSRAGRGRIACRPSAASGCFITTSHWWRAAPRPSAGRSSC